MDGFKSAEKILSFHNDMKRTKGLDNFVQDLKIVAVTSYLNKDTELKAKQVGLEKVYAKPIGINAINEIITGKKFEGEQSVSDSDDEVEDL